MVTRRPPKVKTETVAAINVGVMLERHPIVNTNAEKIKKVILGKSVPME
jgi:hypothetical protein